MVTPSCSPKADDPRATGDGHRPAGHGSGVCLDPDDLAAAYPQRRDCGCQPAQPVTFRSVKHSGVHQPTVDPGRDRVVKDPAYLAEGREELSGPGRSDLGDGIGRAEQCQLGPSVEPVVLPRLGCHHEQSAGGEARLGRLVLDQAADQGAVVPGGGHSESEPPLVGIPGRLGREDAGPGIGGPTRMMVVNEDDIGSQVDELVGQGGPDQSPAYYHHLTAAVAHRRPHHGPGLRRSRRRSRQPCR